MVSSPPAFRSSPRFYSISPHPEKLLPPARSKPRICLLSDQLTWLNVTTKRENNLILKFLVTRKAGRSSYGTTEDYTVHHPFCVVEQVKGEMSHLH